MIDTHTHLQFKAFENNVDQAIKSAKDSGIEKIIIVGTNLETSKKAITLAEKYDYLYASVGIHPHHVFALLNNPNPQEALKNLEQLISNPKVIAIGETGLDKHIYENTKYKNYQITNDFIELQKLFFKEQIKLAIKHQKTLIIHNRGAIPELLKTLNQNWDPFLENRSVFHCCEPDHRLLSFASEHNIFIGIDGDITYDVKKQQFMKQIPLEELVLETDSPYFIPEPLRSAGMLVSKPENINIIAKSVSHLTNHPIEFVREMSSKNSAILFKL